MIEIVEYQNKYAKELSEIILSNMYKINIKEHGKDVIDRISKHFTEDEIRKNFPNRTKCLVALKMIMRLLVLQVLTNIEARNWEKICYINCVRKMQNHNQGIGKKLIENIEDLAINIGCKELVIPASVYACEFYHVNLDLII